MTFINFYRMKHLIQLIKKNKVTTFLTISLIAVACVVFFTKKSNKENDLLPVTLKAVQTSNGWGYEILVDGKVYIHQENIPAINGNKSFRSKSDALFVGNKAIKKLVEGKGKLPVITVEELKQWGITVEDKM